MSVRSLLAALALLAAAAPAAAKDAGQPSEYRPGVTVEHLYKQDIEYYFTNWFGRLEASDGVWRDVYFETAEKYVNKGIMRINCADAEADIDFTLYDVGAYGDAAERRQVTISYADRKAWADGNYEPMSGETPPIEFYAAARQRFCN
ncbi:hypothetical protein [Sphingopyxis macrogoltabida]|uniref:Uncharacterized protein n=1 Tax=Sphingopyxis macrogoltabida TaxID=33050 RepID=A0A0N7GSB9_SPHMC|nr:hypothetical protein [Sphingopyxis macrogoltabida]ALH80283.1 hypothetical protein AN936_07835 [Sphingopyxis macrogoltabida]